MAELTTSLSHAELVVRGYSASGSVLTFRQIRSYRFQSDRFTPADSFFMEALDPIGNWRILRMEVLLNGTRLFSGMVDKQTTVLDDSGRRSTFSCRSRTALLLDNEAQPMTYASFSTLDLLKKHGYPYGITGYQLTQNCTFRSISVAKGMSHWEFISYFCKRAYGSTPFLNRDGVLLLSPLGGKTHRFANNGKNGTIPFSKAVIQEDRFGILSTLHVKTGKDDAGALYNHRTVNSIAESLGIQRERYYHPAVLWESDIRLSARDVIKEAQLDYREIAVTVPLLLDAKVGEYASFDHDQLHDDKLYIAQVRIEGSPLGVQTLLRLWDRTVL